MINKVLVLACVLVLAAGLSGDDRVAPSIAERLTEIDDLTLFTEAVQASGLDEMLAGEGPFTVFAPHNEAMDELSDEDLALAIKAHIVAGEVIGWPFERGTVTALAGNEIVIEIRRGYVYVSGAIIRKSNIEAGNGKIHIIGGVIQP